MECEIYKLVVNANYRKDTVHNMIINLSKKKSHLNYNTQ